ncbi:hypothetical protein [Saliphagus infecundisoli]|uniref:RiboL-PSP-HEPN domain-containing protein n=1 Tax=Saliphagus infecundisoli TaxID=1849069 RepID=A0ABD5QJ47_9EURY|nr:hypothetical protein [Saliphagus infecundisoli]
MDEDIHLGDDGSIVYDGFGEIESLYDRLDSVITAIEDRNTSGNDIILEPEERTCLLEFYVVGHAHLERLTAIILYETLGGEERPPQNTIAFFREFSQARREDLLFHTGIIDSGLKGELSNIRQYRNDLVHAQHNRMYLPDGKPLRALVNRAIDTIQKLDEQVDELGSSASS